MRVRAYRWWFISQVLSASGGTTQLVAQSWLVLHLTHSAFLLSLVATATFTPMLLGGAGAGSMVDRFDRRKVLVLTQSTYMLLGVALGALVATGAVRVWMLFAFAFATGCIGSVDSPARQVFVLELVGTDSVASAIGLNEVVINSSRVLGPALGGVLLATVGFAACFFVNAASYLPPLGVVVVLLWRRGWVRRPASEEDRGPGRVRQGLAFAWHHPAIRYTMLMAVAAGMLFNMGATLPLVATRAFDLGAGGYGAMMATFGAGAVFGALLAGAGPSWPSGRRVRGLAALTGAVVCLAAASPRVGLLFAGLALVGFLSIWFIALANALVQLRTSPELRGRVMGVWTMALPGATPITSLLVGGVATWSGGGAGAREAFGLSGAALLLTVALAWRSLSDRGQAAPSVMPVELGATTTAGQGLRAKV
jgi:MFS family permease